VKHFPLRGGMVARTREAVRAVDGVSFAVELGETLGVVGESGCGKSTLARLILRLIDADAGHVRFRGEDLFATSEARLKRVRRDLQLVFQDPYASLNPRMTARDAIAFNLLIHGTARAERGTVPRRCSTTSAWIPGSSVGATRTSSPVASGSASTSGARWSSIRA
jgi:oligopeptide transport system ATP-binding protein